LYVIVVVWFPSILPRLARELHETQKGRDDIALVAA